MLSKDLLLSLISIIMISWSSFFIAARKETSLHSQHAPSNFILSCNGNTGSNFYEDGSFGADSSNIIVSNPSLAPDFIYSTFSAPIAAHYTLSNNTSTWDGDAVNWINIGDNSNDTEGYMMVINSTNHSGIFFEKTFLLCENNTYELGIDLINLLVSSFPSTVFPNISILVDNVEILNTGDLPQDETWQTFVATFSTAIDQQTATVALRTNQLSTEQQAFALDNITLKSCGPEIIATEINPVQHCPNEAVSFEITVGPEYSTPFIQWQISLDSGDNWTNFGAATSEVTLTINSLPYNARYRALVANADSNIVIHKCVVISNEVIPDFAPIDICAESIADLDDRCSGLRGENILPDGDFGGGIDEILLIDPGFAPGYTYTTVPPPSDGFYTITNNTTDWGSFALNSWINTGDNSNNPEGYMMVVNATVEPGIFFQRTVDVCENTNYEFSVDVINVVKPIGAQRIQPLVDFQIDGVTLYSTGNVPQDGSWKTYGFSFTTAPGVTEVTLSLINNAPGGIGNDLALDNISFLACGPEVTTGAISANSFCPGDSTSLSIEIGPGLDDPVIQWQISLDQGDSWSNLGAASTDTFVLVEALVFDALYRALVAESFSNLQNIACSALSEPISLDFLPIDHCFTSPIQNIDDLCNGLLGPTLTPDGSFGSGDSLNSDPLPITQSDYLFSSDSLHLPNTYSILNQLDNQALNNPQWISTVAPSEEEEDYFMVVNGAEDRDVIFRTQIEGLCENTVYQFSADIINLVKETYAPNETTLPNIDFIIAASDVKEELLAVAPATYTTGDILNDSTWQTYGFTFQTLPGQSELVLALRNNAIGSYGNDFALDNIAVHTCFGAVSLDASPVCEEESLNISASVDSSIAIQWQESIDGGLSWTNLAGEISSNLLVQNPLDSNAYRLIVANYSNEWSSVTCNAFSEGILVSVLPRSFTQIDTSICQGDLFEMAGNLYETAGTFRDTLSSVDACDSIITLNLSLIPPIVTSLSASICEGDQFQLGDSTFVESGNFDYTFQAANGCDSIVQLQLAVVDQIFSPVSSTICVGESLSIGNSIFTEAGMYTIPLIANSGCDSIVQLILETIETTVTNIDTSFCVGSAFQVGNITYSLAGSYTDTLSSSLTGCDSIVNLELSFIAPTFEELDSTICAGNTVMIGTNSYDENGIYIDTLSSSIGCDSIITLNLNVIEADSTVVEETICSGDSIEVAGEIFSESGNYSIVLNNEFNCDSTIFITVHMINPGSETLEWSICENESITVNEITYDEEGTFVQTLQAENGCDSTLTINIFEVQASLNSLNAQICEGETYDFNGQLLEMEGQFLDTLTNANGCDSIIELNLSVLPLSFTTVDTTLCFGESLNIGNHSYMTTGVYIDTLSGIQCDSIVTLSLSVLEEISSSEEAFLCPGDTYEMGNMSFDEPGDYMVTLTAMGGCDSVVALSLIPVFPANTSLSASICEGETFAVGTSIYHQTGIYSDTLLAENGCDSIITLELNVLEHITEEIEVVLCEGDTFNGQIYSSNTTVTEVYQAASGCDSIVFAQIYVSLLGDISIDGLTSLCQGNPSILSVDHHASYLWSTGQQSQEIIASQAGVYSITVSDELGCTSSTNIEVFDEGIEGIISIQEPSCALGTDGAIFIDAVIGGNAPYQYFLDGGSIDTTFKEGLAADIYEVMIVDQTGCEYVEVVQVSDPLPFMLNVGLDELLLLPDSIQLNTMMNGIADSIIWSPIDGLSCSNCLHPFVQPSQTTTYTLTVISINGCIATDQITIEVDSPRRIFTPNIFSPNGDGMNDVFSIQTGPEFVEIIELQIFDRWGSQIWKARGLSPQNGSEGWDGKIQGKDNAPAGVYIYFAELRFFDGRSLMIKGDISLIR